MDDGSGIPSEEEEVLNADEVVDSDGDIDDVAVSEYQPSLPSGLDVDEVAGDHTATIDDVEEPADSRDGDEFPRVSEGEALQEIRRGVLADLELEAQEDVEDEEGELEAQEDVAEPGAPADDGSISDGAVSAHGDATVWRIIPRKRCGVRYSAKVFKLPSSGKYALVLSVPDHSLHIENHLADPVAAASAIDRRSSALLTNLLSDMASFVRLSPRILLINVV